MRKFLSVVAAKVSNFRREEEAASLAEYGILLAGIAVICITAIAALGTQISSMFSTLSGSI